MKPRALKFSIGAALCLVASLSQAAALRSDGRDAVEQPVSSPTSSADSTPPVVDTPPPLGANTPAPAAATPTPKPPKQGKKSKPPGTPKPPKEIPFPLPVGETAKHTSIPEMSVLGQLLSQLSAVTMHHTDNEHVQMQQMQLDLYHPDGKEDFHITMPVSTFDLKTRIITSNDPVVVKADDFELTGERMEFDTVQRTGKLLGHVVMHVHNLKQVAAVPDATPAPSPAEAATPSTP